MTADAQRAQKKMSIQRLAEAPLILYDARWGEADPTRRQLAELGLDGRAARFTLRRAAAVPAQEDELTTVTSFELNS